MDSGVGTGAMSYTDAGVGSGQPQDNANGAIDSGPPFPRSGAGPSFCIDDAPENLSCPEIIPLDGACASKGDCCHRSSNQESEALLGPDDPLVLEYRINFSRTLNHPKSVGLAALANLDTMRLEQEQQSLLWRYRLPRKHGVEVSGPGELTIGYGRYNCDGTYSYYGSNAAPEVPGLSSDPARWQPRVMPIMVDVSKQGADRFAIAFADDRNRELTFVPYLDTASFSYDWEQIVQGFKLLSIDTTQAGRDCQGSREQNKLWSTDKSYQIYAPLDANDVSAITPLNSQTYAQLLAFGPFVIEKQVAGRSAVERCVPGGQSSGSGGAGGIPAGAGAGSDCAWIKLPDSLCPIGADQESLFGCHLGAQGNPNAEAEYPADSELHCTQDAPTSVQDPANGDSAGQCCDALGTSQTLPACNAYRMIQSYVAASAQITDAPSDEMQRKCCTSDTECQAYQSCSNNQCEPKPCNVAADCLDSQNKAECRAGKCELPIEPIQ